VENKIVCLAVPSAKALPTVVYNAKEKRGHSTSKFAERNEGDSIQQNSRVLIDSFKAGCTINTLNDTQL
jgi:hypothetical protein